MTKAATSAVQGSGAKRFVRPERLPAFTLTSRALSLLAYVARHRLIDSDDLARLDGGSEHGLVGKYASLWHCVHRSLSGALALHLGAGDRNAGKGRCSVGVC